MKRKLYSLIKNNCEHFAMWCKSGVSESTQVKMMAKYVIAAGIRLNSVAESEEDIAGYLAGWKESDLNDNGANV